MRSVGETVSRMDVRLFFFFFGSRRLLLAVAFQTSATVQSTKLKCLVPSGAGAKPANPMENLAHWTPCTPPSFAYHGTAEVRLLRERQAQTGQHQHHPNSAAAPHGSSFPLYPDEFLDLRSGGCSGGGLAAGLVTMATRRYRVLGDVTRCRGPRKKNTHTKSEIEHWGTGENDICHGVCENLGRRFLPLAPFARRAGDIHLPFCLTLAASFSVAVAHRQDQLVVECEEVL